MTDRILIDWDEIDSHGLPRCPFSYLFPEPPTAFMLAVVGTYLRDRERYRAVLIDAVVRQMRLTGDRLTIVHQFDGGERPRLLSSFITTTKGEGS